VSGRDRAAACILEDAFPGGADPAGEGLAVIAWRLDQFGAVCGPV